MLLRGDGAADIHVFSTFAHINCLGAIVQIGEKGKFVEADPDVRRDIFNPSEAEIRKMLDENLLKTFISGTVFLHACKKIEEERAAGRKTETCCMWYMVLFNRCGGILCDLLLLYAADFVGSSGDCSDEEYPLRLVFFET